MIEKSIFVKIQFGVKLSLKKQLQIYNTICGSFQHHGLATSVVWLSAKIYPFHYATSDWRSFKRGRSLNLEVYNTLTQWKLL